MLSDITPHPTLPTKDLAVARKFYEDVLGLTPVMEWEGDMVLYACGSGNVLLYASQYAGSNQATAAGWQSADIDDTIEDLRAKGVQFDTFELEGVEWDNGVATMFGMKNVWFRDPDGNILSVGSMPTEAPPSS